MDELELWSDTLLVVWTDHGFLLGEHDCWAKVWMPFYQEIANTPFFVWDPRSGRRGERRDSLVQPSIDLGPTLLEYFGLEPTPHMLGKPLAGVVADDTPVREAALFGMHGGQVNVTDGRYVHMRARAREDNQPLFNYTLMPTAMRGFLSQDSLRQAELAPPFTFGKGCPTLKVPTPGWPGLRGRAHETLLWDVQNDPQQTQPLQDPDVEERMTGHLVRLMRECDAPQEQWERLGLTRKAARGGPRDWPPGTQGNADGII
jgi:hypothetical protein